MAKLKGTWFPLKNFSKGLCHFDWMLGVGSWKTKDALTGAPIKPLETILWNRSKGNLTVGLKSFQEALKDPKNADKIKSLELPTDVKV